MKKRIAKLSAVAALALSSSLAFSTTAMAAPGTDDSSDHGKPAGVVLAPQPLVGIRIALDPGHGGEGDESQPATVADGRGDRTECHPDQQVSPSGYHEADFTFEVSERLTQNLRELGAMVFLTRISEDGPAPCVDQRGTFALDNNVDLMISIHTNHDRDANGAKSYQIVVSSPALSDSQGAPSQELASSLAGALEEAGYEPEVPNDEDRNAANESKKASSAEHEAARDGIDQRGDETILNFARRPAAIVELGSLSTRKAAKEMKSGQAQQDYAEALTEGVLDWVKTHRLLTFTW